MYIYLVKDDYTPDQPTIYGAYISEKLAEEAIELLSSDNNPYGESQNKNDTIEIERMQVTETYPLI